MENISPKVVAHVSDSVCTSRHANSETRESRLLFPSKFLLVQSHAAGAMKLHIHQLNLPRLLWSLAL